MKFKKYDWQLIGGILIFFYINMVFIAKYNPFEINTCWLALIYVPAVCGVFVGVEKLLQFPKTANVLYYAGCIAILAANVALLYFTDYQSVNVDRASGLHNWNDYLLQGVNPYLSKTHMGHSLSVFPVWALLHLPFYLLGDVGYSQVFFLALLFAVLRFCFRSRSLLYMSLLAMSPTFWYHCAVRSDILNNFDVALVFVVLLLRFPAFWQKRKLITAFVAGLLVCTRIPVAVPLFLYFFRYWLDFSWRDKVSFALLGLAGFAVPFVPFIVWGYEPLFASWHLQTTPGSGNVWVALFCLVLAVWVALRLKTERQLFFWSGFILFAVMFLTSLQTLVNKGFVLMLRDDLYDISYYSVCLPFVIYFLSIGKVIPPSDTAKASAHKAA